MTSQKVPPRSMATLISAVISWFLDDWEKQRCRERIEEEGRKPIGKLDLTIIRRIFCSWEVYAFTLAYSFWTLTCGSYIIQYLTLSLPQIDQALHGPRDQQHPHSGLCRQLLLHDQTPATYPTRSVAGAPSASPSAPYSPLSMSSSPLGPCRTPSAWPSSSSPAATGATSPSWLGGRIRCAGAISRSAPFVLGFIVSVGKAVVVRFQQLQMPSSQALIPLFQSKSKINSVEENVEESISMHRPD
ncbi:hypothetical protein MY11210_003704 [Beauveria gryllotalpidicola]